MKWRIEGYHCWRDGNKVGTIHLHCGEYWLIAGCDVFDGFGTLAEAKKKAKKAYGKAVKFKPFIWVLEVSIESPRGDTDSVLAEVRYCYDGGHYNLTVAAPYIRVGHEVCIATGRLIRAKEACENLIQGMLGFLEVLGWKRVKE